MNFLLVFVFFFMYTMAIPWNDLNVSIAVVEFKPNRDVTTALTISNNLLRYVTMGSLVGNVDMIIFPEDTIGNNLATAVEIAVDDNPCDMGANHTLYSISCLAKSFKQYIIINLVTQHTCQSSNQTENCQEYGYFYHNTDLVFNRSGTVIAMYHKYNLFGEKPLNRPEKPEKVIFETDFGIKFGIFTCFDILFKSPAQDLVPEVNAVIFPTMWFSELPFLTGIQVQQMWSQAHDIPIFASGANDPVRGSGGTGVYAGTKGAIISEIIAEGGSDFYIFNNSEAKIPEALPTEEIDILAQEMDDFYLKRDPTVIEYSSEVLDTSTNFDGPVCYNGTEGNQFCCNFTIATTTKSSDNAKNSYTYHMVVYSDVRSFDGVYNGGVEICGIIACLNSSLSSCGQRFPKYEDIEWPVTFENIIIKGYFDNSENRTQYPNSLLSSIRPIQANLVSWDKEEKIFTLLEPQNRILTFAIYGRNFDLDYPPDEDHTDNNDSNNKDDNNSATLVGYRWMLIYFVISFFGTIKLFI